MSSLIHNDEIYHPKHLVGITAQEVLAEGNCRSFDQLIDEVTKRLAWCSRSYADHVLQKWRSRIESDIVDSAVAGKHIQILNNTSDESTI